MVMDTLTLRIEPLAPFGTVLMGDTLFGQLCWAVRHRYGEGRLRELLEGYTTGQPFAVVADACPEGYLPRPALPLSYFREVPEADRKRVKKQVWLPLNALDTPLPEWLGRCRSDRDLAAILQRNAAPGDEPEQSHLPLMAYHPQQHNTINRLTGTTGRGEFAPYTLLQRWYAPDLALSCRVVFAAERVEAQELIELFNDIGAIGFGRDASIGLGKFRVDVTQEAWPSQADANACLTLAPCAPQGLGFDSQRSYYAVFTRFGRHGDAAAHLGHPFKSPVLLARTGAVLFPPGLPEQRFVGQGLGGSGELSKVIAETVHQGYAPCIPIHWSDEVAA
jgi:CRISPR-associated protein Csm4